MRSASFPSNRARSISDIRAEISASLAALLVSKRVRSACASANAPCAAVKAVLADAIDPFTTSSSACGFIAAESLAASESVRIASTSFCSSPAFFSSDLICSSSRDTCVAAASTIASCCFSSAANCWPIRSAIASGVSSFLAPRPSAPSAMSL
ncbi:MAG: hypothetical protein HY079_07880 [Elusimicrobia bacterium]|nr:hypothetical protein [Elusimicrobiota bacterium]